MPVTVMFKGRGRDDNSTRLADYKRDLHAVALARLQWGGGGVTTEDIPSTSGDDYLDRTSCRESRVGLPEALLGDSCHL